MVTKADMRMCPYCAVLKRSHASPKTQVARIRFPCTKSSEQTELAGVACFLTAATCCVSLATWKNLSLRIFAGCEPRAGSGCAFAVKTPIFQASQLDTPGLLSFDMCASKTFRSRALTKAPMCTASTGCQVSVLPGGP